VRTTSSGSHGRRVRGSGQAKPVVRKPSTKELLIGVGEDLFGRFGIDAVSLREIAVAAGQTSSNAVQYHFGDKRGLVRAILDDRLLRHELHRREQLKALQTVGKHAPRDLLQILWGSIVSLRSADGQYSFCRFVLQYMLQAQGPDRPAREKAARSHKRTVVAGFASLFALNESIRACYPNLSDTQFEYRWKAVAIMFLAAVVGHDNAQLAKSSGVHQEFDLRPIMDLALAALSAPTP
jgi:AcrR family transcriptional regulator